MAQKSDAPVEVIFTQSFSSPVFGNVWEGRKAYANPDMVAKLLAGGLAEVADGSKAAVVPVDPSLVQTPAAAVAAQNEKPSVNIVKGAKHGGGKSH